MKHETISEADLERYGNLLAVAGHGPTKEMRVAAENRLAALGRRKPGIKGLYVETSSEALALWDESTHSNESAQV